jgi:hypothetical protein
MATAMSEYEHAPLGFDVCDCFVDGKGEKLKPHASPINWPAWLRSALTLGVTVSPLALSAGSAWPVVLLVGGP